MFVKKKDLDQIILSENANIFEVVKSLNSSGMKVALFENKKKQFVGLINDGDIRRSLLKGYNVNSKVEKIINRNCVILNYKKKIEDQLQYLKKNENHIREIPIIENNKIKGLYLDKSEDKKLKKIKKEKIVIMAGGYGKRLGNLTKNCPKPLLLYKDKPLLKHIVENCLNYGFNNFIISIFYLKKMIKNYFKKNLIANSKINFIEEKEPLGTIGSLKLIKKISDNFILMNCDVLTECNLEEILYYHKKNKAILTIGIKHFKYQNPYGVIVTKNNNFLSFKEKPQINFKINAGIYVFNSRILEIVKKNKIQFIEELITLLQKRKKKIITFPIYENWFDLGQDKKNLKIYK